MSYLTNLSRRTFLQRSAAIASTFAMGSIIPLELTAKGLSTPKKKSVKSGFFPEDFWWGAATAAYQVEGAVNEDGRGQSIWDTFSHTAGRTFNGDTGDVACNQYQLFESDIKLMAELGIKHYRFSISWSRILPDGRGQVNEKGMDYYRRLIDTLLKYGIEPHATLYHWDLPQALQNRYLGWQSREIVGDFADYATVVVKRLGDRVQHWMTLNEISSMTYNGYGVKNKPIHAPGLMLNSRKEFLQIIHNALLAHGACCQAIRAASPGKSFVSIAENFNSYVPVIETFENIIASRKAFLRDEKNGGIIMPVLTGNYSETWLADCGADAPTIAGGDMKLIGQPLDELGYNCYSGVYVATADNEKGFEAIPFNSRYPKGNVYWLNILPESIYWGVRHISETAGCPNLPIFISENGLADGTVLTAKGELNDIDRVMYYRSYLTQVHRAVAEGFPLIGYFPWSLLDNYEWADGYSSRFGMVYVDYATQKRIPKLSYHWYQQVIKNSRVM